MEDLLNDAEVLYQLLTRLRRVGVGAAPPELAQLSPPLMLLLEQVTENPGRSIVDLAQRVGRRAPTVSIELRHLEEAGLVARRPHPGDRRALQVFPTSKGKNLYQKVQAARRETFARLLSGLSSEERRTLIELLQKAVVRFDPGNPPVGEEKP